MESYISARVTALEKALEEHKRGTKKSMDISTKSIEEPKTFTGLDANPLLVQPVEFVHKNKLSFLQGCIVKRIIRYNLEGGKGRQDLEKIKHEVDLLIELEKL